MNLVICILVWLDQDYGGTLLLSFAVIVILRDFNYINLF